MGVNQANIFWSSLSEIYKDMWGFQELELLITFSPSFVESLSQIFVLIYASIKLKIVKIVPYK